MGLTLLSVYVAVLWGVPTMQTIGVLGSLGAPSMLVGLVCLIYWAWYRMAGYASGRPFTVVQITFMLLLATIWLSFAFAQARGLPADEVSPSISGLLRSLSWAGVFLLATDAIVTKRSLVTLVRRFVLFGGLMALLGLTQLVSGESLVDRFHIPGLAVSAEQVELVVRSGFSRASGTATHPLEYAVVLVAVFPLSVAVALGRRRLSAWWVPAATGLACIVSASRSAIIGLLLGLLCLMPSVTSRVRRWFGVAVLASVVLIVVAFPVFLESLADLFFNQEESTASRTSGQSVALVIASHHPILGRGFGTFLPKYYILDNQILIFLIEIGIIGLIAFLALALISTICAWRVRSMSPDPEMSLIAGALVASMIATTALFAFFDALSFGMAAGSWFMLTGLCGAVWQIMREETINRSDDGIGIPRQPKVSAPRATLAIVVGSGIMLGALWLVLLGTPERYATRSEMLLVDEAFSDQEALLEPPSHDLLPVTWVVEGLVNEGREPLSLNSDQATLDGVGVRNGVSVRVLNTGNQWEARHPRPSLVVESVAESGQSALAMNEAAAQDIVNATRELQSDLGIPSGRRVRAVPVLAEPTVSYVGGSRIGKAMALVASGLVVGAAAWGAVSVARRRLGGQSPPRPW